MAAFTEDGFQPLTGVPIVRLFVTELAVALDGLRRVLRKPFINKHLRVKLSRQSNGLLNIFITLMGK